MSFSQIQTKSLFKAVGDIMTSDSQMTTLNLEGVYLEETIASDRPAPYATMQIILGPTDGNLPSKDGLLVITFWGRARDGSADIQLRDLGDRAEYLFDGDEGKDRINNQGMTNFTLRYIEHENSDMLPIDSRNNKGYRLTFSIIVSKV